MTDNKHTPGPWRCWQLPREMDTNYWRIATTYDAMSLDTVRGYCGEANARLIAAAPELLAACEALANADVRMVDGLEVLDGDLSQYVDMARDAIAKAKGISTE
jgi:hypothetical protein